MDSDLPPDLAMLSHILDGQPPQVRELFHYALFMLLIENGKAESAPKETLSSDAQQTSASA